MATQQATTENQRNTAIMIVLIIAAVIGASLLYQYSLREESSAVPDQTPVVTSTPTGEETGVTATDTAPVPEPAPVPSYSE